MIDFSSIKLSSLPSLPLDRRSLLPQVPCIYFVIDSEGIVQYIGRSVNLQQRWVQHHRQEQFKSMGAIRINWLVVDTPDLLPEIEAALIEWFNPLLNQTKIFPRLTKASAQKPKISIYLGQELLEWFKHYCKTQERSVPAQIAFMIKQLKSSK